MFFNRFSRTAARVRAWSHQRIGRLTRGTRLPSTVTAADPRGVVGGERYGLLAGDAYGLRFPARVRGGVVSRTGDRVGDALEMRTRRVGVEGFVVASLRCSVVASLRTGERSILLSFLGAGCPLPRFFFA